MRGFYRSKDEARHLERHPFSPLNNCDILFGQDVVLFRRVRYQKMSFP